MRRFTLRKSFRLSTVLHVSAKNVRRATCQPLQQGRPSARGFVVWVCLSAPPRWSGKPVLPRNRTRRRKLAGLVRQADHRHLPRSPLGASSRRGGLLRTLTPCAGPSRAPLASSASTAPTRPAVCRALPARNARFRARVRSPIRPTAASPVRGLSESMPPRLQRIRKARPGVIDNWAATRPMCCGICAGRLGPRAWLIGTLAFHWGVSHRCLSCSPASGEGADRCDEGIIQTASEAEPAGSRSPPVRRPSPGVRSCVVGGRRPSAGSLSVPATGRSSRSGTPLITCRSSSAHTARCAAMPSRRHPGPDLRTPGAGPEARPREGRASGIDLFPPRDRTPGLRRPARLGCVIPLP
jgi:hypothetical protein